MYRNNTVISAVCQKNNSTENKSQDFKISDAQDRLLPVIKSKSVNHALRASTEFERNPVGYIKKLTKADRKFLDQLLYLQSKYDSVWMGFDRLAQVTGYCSRTMKRAAKKLEEKGLISHIMGSYVAANEYHLHPLFASFTMRRKLSKLLPALRFTPSFLKIAVAALLSVQIANVTAISPRIDINKNSNSSLSITKDAHPRSKGVISVSLFKEIKENAQFARQLKERRMQQSEKAINAIRTLKLTVWGKMVLSAYPAEAIRYADEQIFMAKKLPHNPLGLFKSLCTKFCEKNNLKPDWSRVEHWKTKVPWDYGFYEVTENVVHENYWMNQELLSKAKPYKPGNEWELAQQKKKIMSPLAGKDLSGIRLPAWTESEDAKERKKLVATAEIDRAVKLAQEQGAMNPFMAILMQAKAPIEQVVDKPLVDPNNQFLQVLAPIAEKMENDALESIKTVSGNVNLYQERKEIPTAWHISEQLVDEDDVWQEVG